MNTAAHFYRLLVGLRADGDAVLAVGRLSETRWAVVISDETQLVIDHQPASEKFVFSIDLGTPAAQDRTAVYETLLVFNSLTEGTGGVTLALTEPGGSVMMWYELRDSGLDQQTVTEVVTGLAARAAIWRLALTRVEDQTGAVDLSDAMRV